MTQTATDTYPDLCSDCLDILDEHCTYCGECFCEAEECRDEEAA